MTRTDGNQINILARLIGPDQPPYVIAEMSANHNGDLENAYRIPERRESGGSRCNKDADLPP